jgi:8-oxo-dGTP diphosphatase
VDGAADVCVAAMLRCGERILLCHRRPDRAWYPDVWDLPGGHVESGETLPSAVARELREELGVVISPPTDPPFETLRDEDLRIELTIWLIDHDDGGVENRAPDEHDELRWVTRGDIGSLPLADPSYLALLDRAFES